MTKFKDSHQGAVDKEVWIFLSLNYETSYYPKERRVIEQFAWTTAEETICALFRGVPWRTLDSFHWTVDTELRPQARVSRQLKGTEMNILFESMDLICHNNLFKVSISIANYMHFIVTEGYGRFINY